MAARHPGGGTIITKQADADNANINTIMEKWAIHGDVPLNGRTPTYGDFTNAGDFHSALNKIMAAKQDFSELPAYVRRHVDHDAGKFLDMVFDPERRGELEELGLVPERAPASAPPATEAPEPPTPPVPDPPT